MLEGTRYTLFGCGIVHISKSFTLYFLNDVKLGELKVEHGSENAFNKSPSIQIAYEPPPPIDISCEELEIKY